MTQSRIVQLMKEALHDMLTNLPFVTGIGILMGLVTYLIRWFVEG